MDSDFMGVIIAQPPERTASMDESKIDELRLIHRDLARLLGEQHEVILSQRLVIVALQRTVEGDPALSKKYVACLQALKSDPSARPNPMQAGFVQKLLDRLKNW
jgi:predicted ThiF/HesA family dinucleotide-utilizing enzyme